MTLSNEQKGTFYAIISGLLYGLLGYFGLTIINAGFSKYNMLFWRFLIAGIFMFLVTIPQLKNLHYKPQEIFKVFFYGAVFHGISVIFYFTSALYIGSGIAMVLLYLYPALVMLINRLFYRAEITKLYYYSISLILIGLILLVDISNLKFDLLGIIFGILNAIFYSFYVVTSKNSKISSPSFATFVMCLGCATMALIFALIDRSFKLPTDIAMLTNLVAMSIFCTALPVLYLLKALQYIDAAKGSILSISEPLAVMFFGYILLGEKTTLIQFLGAITILSGAIIALNPWKALGEMRNILYNTRSLSSSRKRGSIK